MNVDEILGTRDPVRAAVELVRRFEKHPDFPALATRWLQLATIIGVDVASAVEPIWSRDTFEASRGRLPARRGGLGAMRQVLLAAAAPHAEEVALVLGVSEVPGVDEVRLALALAAAPVGPVGDVLASWAAEANVHVARRVAVAFCEDLDRCARLLAAPVPKTCAACHGHPEDSTDAWVDVVAERGRRRLTRSIAGTPLAVVPPSLWLEDYRLGGARKLRDQGVAIPGLDEEARAALKEDRDWHRGLRWLVNTPGEQERCVAVLAERVRCAEDVRVPLLAACGDEIEVLMKVGTFHGPGFNRDDRPRLLVPLARALLDRREWPLQELWLLLTTRLPDHSPEEKRAENREQTWTYVQEMLAEGLLQIGLDATSSLDERRRALRALGELRPGGNGSWSRALGKVTGDLRGAARAIQKEIKRLGPAPDAELAVGDAIGAFFAGPHAG